jgi:AcrR family transcriptional regulator
MPDNVLDRRVVRTRQILQEALVSLMKERQYDRITVQDIIDRANVGRSTFYSHFITKDELLKSSIEQMIQSLSLYIPHMSDDPDHPGMIPVACLFKHIQENSPLVKALIRGKSADLFVDKIQEHLNEKFEKFISELLKKGKQTAIPIPILSNYICSTLIFLLKWWLDNKMQYTPAQMEQYFYGLVIPSVKAAIRDY